MTDSARFERNLGFLSVEEQAIIQGSSVAIAGAGGDGGMLAIQLARMGVGELRLADPDPFEIENINRQAVCTDLTVGKNKATAVAEFVKLINPDISTIVYEDGINILNVESFLTGADLLIDETEFTLHALAVLLAREARNQNIPNLTAMNVGFGTVVTTYKPDGPKLEKRLGFKEDQGIIEIDEAVVPLSRWLPYIPPYADLKVFEKVAKGEKSAPSVAPGVAMAAGVGASQAMLNLLRESDNKRVKPTYAPRAIVIDAMTIKARKVRYNRTSHYKSLSRMVARNTLHLNPSASY